MGQKRALEGGIDPHQHAADAAEPEPGPQILQAVVQHYGHIVAKAHADPGIAIARPVGQGVDLPIGMHMPALKLDQRRIAPHPRLLRQDLARHPTRFIRHHRWLLPYRN